MSGGILNIELMELNNVIFLKNLSKNILTKIIFLYDRRERWGP